METIAVADASQVGDARRNAVALSKRLGFSETAAARVGIIATELSTNLFKHGVAGELLIGAYEDETGSGFECLALDKGPGMADVRACLEDGYSTSGTSGTGLGAVVRQAQVFDIFSQPGRGSAVLARVTDKPAAKAQPMSSTGCVAVAYPGESACGDGWRVKGKAPGLTMMVVDGLGHGILAAEASNTAIRTFDRLAQRNLTGLVEAMHEDLKKTRGAAVGVARYDPESGVVSFCGVGNVAAAVISGATTRRMVSHNGTVGHTVRRVQVFDYPVSPPFLVVLASDGLATSWTFDGYAGLQARHPTLIAGVLYRDFYRRRDDVTVLVVREPAA